MDSGAISRVQFGCGSTNRNSKMGCPGGHMDQDLRNPCCEILKQATSLKGRWFPRERFGFSRPSATAAGMMKPIPTRNPPARGLNEAWGLSHEVPQTKLRQVLKWPWGVTYGDPFATYFDVHQMGFEAFDAHSQICSGSIEFSRLA